MPIQKLSEQLASQIAAGEVVERPASVVKELVENAIDAGATVINVDINDGGRTRIQIADDGMGIPHEQVETAFLRHATSKISSVEQLAAIETLGFRGEALAAIASVSHVTIVTRSAEDSSGTRLILEGGHILQNDHVGAPLGTVISIENLFYNTPARLKFLKSDASEKRAIDEFLTRCAMAYPAIRFRLVNNGRISFQTNGRGDLMDTLISVYGADVARNFLELQGDENAEISVSGYIGLPSEHRSNRTHISLFVNGRWVKDQKLAYAVVQAYHTMLPVRRFPMAVIFIRIPYELVDVNVHPTKAEVRFQNERHVFGTVQKRVRERLLASNPVRDLPDEDRPFTQITGEPIWTKPTHNPILDPSLGQPSRHQSPMNLPRPEPLPPARSGAEMGQSTAQPEMDLGGERLPIMRVVGQISAAYIITEGPEGMYLIDQHAAHERILYDKLLVQRQKEGVPSQQLVAGLSLHLAPDQATLLEEHLPALIQLGFEVEPFGPNAFMIRAVPVILNKVDPAVALRTVLEELEMEKNPLQAKIEDMVLRKVCKSIAIKAGQLLSSQEMDELVRQLEQCHTPHTCPHGRPTLIHLSVMQLAKQFGRM